MDKNRDEFDYEFIPIFVVKSFESRKLDGEYRDKIADRIIKWVLKSLLREEFFNDCL